MKIFIENSSIKHELSWKAASESAVTLAVVLAREAEQKKLPLVLARALAGAGTRSRTEPQSSELPLVLGSSDGGIQRALERRIALSFLRWYR